MTVSPRSRAVLSVRSFCGDSRGVSAVEFAIVAMPFFMLMLGIIQLGIFYMTQSALNTGVLRAAETLRNTFVTGGAMPSASTLKSSVVAAGGGMVANDANLAVEIRQASALTSGTVAISDGTTDYGTTSSTLVLRARAPVLTLAPGLGSLNVVTSSALVRRQGT